MSLAWNRREFLRRGILTVGAAGLAVSGLGPLARAAAPFPGVGPATRDPNRLVALPGKRPLVQIYDKPPVYETPTAYLIGDELYPLTNRDAYYVRWREALIPEIKPEELRLEVGGDAAVRPRTFTLDELKAFGEVSVAAVGSCKRNASGTLRPMLGGVPWGKGDVSAAKWTGVRVKDVLEAVGVKENAVQVAFKSAGFTIALAAQEYWRIQSVDEMMDPKAILAYRMNDGEIPIWNGAPLRLVNPGEYAPEWVKQVVRIEIRSTPIENRWAGTHAGPDPIRIVSLVTTPQDGERLPSGREVELTGVAYDSGVGIAKVEVSIDGGKSWERASLEPLSPHGRYVWRVWHYRFTPRQRGPLTVFTRATGVEGEVQPFGVQEAHYTSNGRRMNSIVEFAAHLEVV
ncbi:molybdopterin-dependent oxidoreductase [Limnochorda pilosa]|uniref:Oxidoreductase n=1 Tax=Limnochorda pilosa TaxID=1555112 RepID=A0A0K2SGN3_LIMPI|nr:molybdopterin-dependent oxidoreductase [Limnochorda pilosa]BAS26004.1 oxidoreductase [Limnochorda pilosa]